MDFLPIIEEIESLLKQMGWVLDFLLMIQESLLKQKGWVLDPAKSGTSDDIDTSSLDDDEQLLQEVLQEPKQAKKKIPQHSA